MKNKPQAPLRGKRKLNPKIAKMGLLSLVLAGNAVQAKESAVDRIGHLAEESSVGLHFDLVRMITDARLGLNFAGEKVPAIRQEKVHKEIPKNISNDERGREMIERAMEWKDEMLGILRHYGVPEDFFYLMVAESGVANVTSPVGAKGYWQFMPATAREYGLVVEGKVDERLDPIKATHAAAKYLKDSYMRFGDWTLVAASYNMGMGGVSKAMKTQRIDNYYDLRLNPETSRYVYRILALKTVMNDPDKYGFDKAKLAYRSLDITSARESPGELKSGS